MAETGGGDGQGPGGIRATVGLDTTGLEADFARTKAMLDRLAAQYGMVGTSAAAAATATQKLDAGLRAAGTGSAMFAMRMMVVGQMVDDVQYGISAIVNQIPQAVMAFGGSAGLAGGAAIAAVAVNQLVMRWGTLQEMMGTGIPVPALEGLEKLEARLKEVDKRIGELRAKKRLDIAESYEFGKLGEERAALKADAAGERELEKITDGRPKADAARGAAFVEAVRESGGRAALEGLTEALAKGANAQGLVSALGAEVGTPRKVAEDLFRAAARGDAQARESIRGATAGTDFARRIGETAPEAVALEKARADGKKAERDLSERSDKLRKQRGEDEARAAKAAAEERAGWEAQGRENVRKFERSRAEEIVADTPGAGTLAERSYMQLLAQSGGDPAKAREALQGQLKGQLVAAGATEEEALRKASEMSKAAGRSVDEDIIQRRLNPEVRSSQVMGAADLNRSVQSAITNDNPLVRTNKQMLEQLVKIAGQMPGGGAPVKAGGP